MKGIATAPATIESTMVPGSGTALGAATPISSDPAGQSKPNPSPT
jgi:hypothetical protein